MGLRATAVIPPCGSAYQHCASFRIFVAAMVREPPSAYVKAAAWRLVADVRRLGPAGAGLMVRRRDRSGDRVILGQQSEPRDLGCYEVPHSIQRGRIAAPREVAGYGRTVEQQRSAAGGRGRAK